MPWRPFRIDLVALCACGSIDQLAIEKEIATMDTKTREREVHA